MDMLSQKFEPSERSTSPVQFRGRIRGLAEEQRLQAAKHLGYLALAFGIYTMVGISTLLLPDVGAYITQSEITLTVITGVILTIVSLAVFFMSRSSGISTQRKLDIGLIYQVLGAFTWSLGDVYRISPSDPVGHRVPYIVLWVTLYPIVAPNKFGRSFLANLLAACTPFFAYMTLSAFNLLSEDFNLIYLEAGPVITVALIIMIPVYFHNKIRKDMETAEKMGSYELVEKLGEGAMGEVWKARHNFLANESAIKLIKPEALLRRSDESNAELAVRRFEREARSTAALNSPNTINLYDFGVTENGTCYYVMELLDGLDLDTLVNRFGPVDPNRAVYLLRQICRSLIEAHEAGLVHRDIKPANIFICRLKPDCDVIKVLDFGLVKHSVFTTDETKLTTEGMIAGTPAYLAPEQARGEKQIDGRADIYAVGCVAYWLITACQVFEADTPMKVILAHVSENPIPPSQRNELDIPASFETVILRCLQKDPAKRPQSARELETLLAEIEEDRTWSRLDAENWWYMHLPERTPS